jgi:signal transduction histidine kinase
MEDFTHHAGHELKNPLASLKSSIELLKEFWEYKPKLVNQSLEEIKKINSLVDTLKDFSFLENDKIFEEIDVSLEIKNIIKKYYKQIKEKNIKIIFEQKNNFILKAPKNHFYILFSNLFSNAIKYTKENPEIKIIIDKNFFIIKDNWIWIKNENLNKIFKKFYREKNHRDSKGFGLGLSLVEKIIKINSWKIEIKSEVWKTTEIKIKF